MPKDRVDLIQRLRKPTQDFIEYIRENETKDPPKRLVYTWNEDGSLDEKETKDYATFDEKYREDAKEFFLEVANWLADSNKGYRYIEDGDTNRRPGFLGAENRSELISHYINDFKNVSVNTIEYAGGYQFQEELYKEAANDLLHQFYLDGGEFKLIIPLLNSEIPDSIIHIPPSGILNHQHGTVKTIQIGRITASEAAGIKTREKQKGPFFGPNISPDDIQNVCRIEIEGPWTYSDWEVLPYRIATGLRLFGPDKGFLQFGPAYLLKKTDLYHRYQIESVITQDDRLIRRPISLSGPSFELTESDAESLQRFWSRYVQFFELDSDSKFVSSLRRFNEMYYKPILEDHIVDCVIACEGTLLKDVKSGSSYRFRLSLRAGMLLNDYIEWEKEEIRDFVESLYYTRGEIVHNDRKLNEVFLDRQFSWRDGEIKTGEFVAKARLFLSKVLISYMDKTIEEGMNITQVNQDIDKAVKEISYE